MTNRALVAIVSPTILCVTNALAQDSAPSESTGSGALGAAAETGVATTYVVRGRPQYADRSTASSQSLLILTRKDLGPGDLTAGIFNATALGSHARQPGTAVEIDAMPSYSVALGRDVTATAGYIGYFFPSHAPGRPLDGAHEAWGSLAYSGLGVTITGAAYGEFVRQRGVYAPLALSRSFAFGAFTFAPAASAAVARYAGTPTNLNDVTVTAPLDWGFARGLYASARPSASYLAGPRATLPNQDGSAAGRFVPSVLLAVGGRLEQ